MLKRIIVFFLGMFLIAGSLFAGEWKVDNTHSTISFKIRHLVVSSVSGSFSDFSGVLDWDGSKENIAKGKGELNINVASISTGNDKRDDHLRTSDFFNVGKFPTINFSWTKANSVEGDNFQLIGKLTMKGITKEFTFNCTFNGQVEYRGSKRTGFSAEAVIDRTEFGMESASLLDTGGLTLGNDVSVELVIAFVYQE